MDERLEQLKIAHETLEMMIQLIKDLGFKPPLEISQYQGTNAEKATTLYDEKLMGVYQGYASMLEDREKLKIKIDSLTAQNVEILDAAGKNGSAKKKASTRRAKRRGDPWDRPRKRRRQPKVGKEQISNSLLSSEIVCNGDTVWHKPPWFRYRNKADWCPWESDMLHYCAQKLFIRRNSARGSWSATDFRCSAQDTG